MCVNSQCKWLPILRLQHTFMLHVKHPAIVSYLYHYTGAYKSTLTWRREASPRNLCACHMYTIQSCIHVSCQPELTQ